MNFSEAWKDAAEDCKTGLAIRSLPMVFAILLMSLVLAIHPARADEEFVRCGAPTIAPAIEACTRILHRRPAPPANIQAIVYYDRAVATKDQGDPIAARRDLDASIRLKPLASAHFLRGVIAMDAHDPDAALDDYGAALALDPRNVAIMTDKALVLDGKGEIETAVKLLDAALKIEPGNATTLNQRGNLLGKLGRNAEAKRDWQRAAALDEQFAALFKQNQRVVRVMVPPKQPLPFETASIRPGSRVALVIGISSYRFVPTLPNPVSDARKIGAVLKNLGFSVSPAFDVDHKAFQDALAAFTQKAAKADVAVIFYAGHGLQIAKGNTGENFLVPVDADLVTLADVKRKTIAAADLLATMSGARSRILFLDACRANPFAERLRSGSNDPATRSIGRGLGRTDINNGQSAGGPDSGTLVVFSTAANQTALDASPFAPALARYLLLPGLEIKTVVSKVGEDVVKTTGRKQTPFLSSSLFEEIYLAGQ